jgi:hypothetical protein
MTARRKARPEKTPVPDVTGMSADAVLSRARVVALIAERIPHRQVGDEERARRDRVQKRIIDHANKGLLARRANGSFLLGEVARWARETWPECFDDLPAFPRQASGSTVEEVRVGTSMSALVLPGTLAGCHAAIESMDARILVLERELSKERKQVSQLMPDAQRYQEIRRKNQASGKKSRGQ